MSLLHEKNVGRKSRDTVPLTICKQMGPGCLERA